MSDGERKGVSASRAGLEVKFVTCLGGIDTDEASLLEEVEGLNWKNIPWSPGDKECGTTVAGSPVGTAEYVRKEALAIAEKHRFDYVTHLISKEILGEGLIEHVQRSIHSCFSRICDGEIQVPLLDEVGKQLLALPLRYGGQAIHDIGFEADISPTRSFPPCTLCLPTSSEDSQNTTETYL